MGLSSNRRQLLDHVADRVPEPRDGGCRLVAVDGPDGAGKTMFADQLAAVLRPRNRPVVRILLDDFHNVRAVRYRQGRESPVGFWQDSDSSCTATSWSTAGTCPTSSTSRTATSLHR